MHEYRLTRRQLYQHPNCFGFADLEARFGYYITSESEEAAIARMTELYPDDDTGFTAQLWKTDYPVCRVKKGNPLTCDPCTGKGQVELSVTKKQGFIASKIHQGQMIGILVDEAGFTFHIYSPGSSFEDARTRYPDLGAALNAAQSRVEQDSRWSAGFEAYERGEPFPQIADSDFASGWRDAQQAYEGVAA